MNLQVVQALIELSVGQAELPLNLSTVVSGGERLLLLQLSTVELHVLLELLVLHMAQERQEQLSGRITTRHQ